MISKALLKPLRLAYYLADQSNVARTKFQCYHIITNAIHYDSINRDGQLDFLKNRTLIERIYPDSEIFENVVKDKLKVTTTIYAGFDPTSDSLHVGNLLSIINLIHLRNLGHQVICVIGDATAQIGDPSGHEQDRARMPKEEIEANSSSIESIIHSIFSNHDKYFMGKDIFTNELQQPIIVRNSMWYKDYNILDFVSEIFRELRVGELLHKKSISERLKSPAGMNLSEFCYQAFQAYDWLILMKKYDCQFQLGGADQSGNIFTGHKLIKKHSSDQESIGLLTPLITSSSGKKLGKSDSMHLEGNSAKGIWLKPERTGPFDLYQHFRNTPDTDVTNFLKKFSFYDDKTIEEMVSSKLRKDDPNFGYYYCQIKLAEHVCKLIHGEDGLEFAKSITRTRFGRVG